MSWTLSYSQFYIDNKGDTISYTGIPSGDDFMGQYLLGNRVYKTYHDTIHHVEVRLPDSSKVFRTGTPNCMIFRLPKRQGLFDFISVTSFSIDKFLEIDSLILNNLTKHKPGEYLNGNKQGIFQAATLIDTLTYKVEIDCNGNSCIQQWRFVENEFGYYVIMLAARKETYELRLGTFDNFVKENLSIE